MADKEDPKTLNLYQKLAAITGEVGAVAKGGRNTQQNFDFIEYAAVAGNLRGLFSKYGVVIVPRMQRADKQKREINGKAVSVLIDFYFTVVNADKPEDRFNVSWTGEAIDYGDKATNKAATSALKYYLMRQFNISEKGEDPDEHSPERPSGSANTSTTKTQPAKTDKSPESKTPQEHVTEVFDDAEETVTPEQPSKSIMLQIRAKISSLGLDKETAESVIAKAVDQRAAEKINQQLQEKLDARKKGASDETK